MIITRENVFDHVTKTVNEFTWAETFTTNDGRLRIVAHRCTSDPGPHGLMKLWKKHGYITKELDTYICVDTYHDEDETHCVRKYDATFKRDAKTGRNVINFDYLLEWTEENIIGIVVACLNMRENDIAMLTV